MNRRQRLILVLALVLFVAGVILARGMMFTVDEREQAVVLQFGRPVASYTEPGLKFMTPFTQTVRRLPKSLQLWYGSGSDMLVDLPTNDGTKIEVTAWAIWRISDPRRFVEVLKTVENGELRVKTFVRSEVRNVVTSNNLIDVVRSTKRSLSYTFQTTAAPGQAAAAAGPAVVDAPPQPVGADQTVKEGREKIIATIREGVRKRLKEASQKEQGGRGIEIVDVGLASIEFVPDVRESAFNRLIAYMESIASLYTNEGQRRKQEILNETAAEVQKIEGEGQQLANTLRGDVEAEVIEAYAKAMEESGEFYNFIRTLEAYKTILNQKTRLVLSTDSALFDLLKRGPATPSGTTMPNEKPER